MSKQEQITVYLTKELKKRFQQAYEAEGLQSTDTGATKALIIDYTKTQERRSKS